jgi:predicted Zn-dependent peptidase
MVRQNHQKPYRRRNKAYYQSVLTKSRMLIVVVADLDRAAIEAKVKAMLNRY